MKKQFFILLCMTVLIMQGPVVNAQKQTGKNTPDFKTWSEEQIQQWNDSVKKALYPDLKIKMTVVPTDTSTATTSGIKRAIQVTNNTYVPNSVIIDKTKPVGEIPISSAVSPAGAIIYNVPVEVYPGVHGMQPQLSIAYNNQAGNGMLYPALLRQLISFLSVIKRLLILRSSARLRFRKENTRQLSPIMAMTDG